MLNHSNLPFGQRGHVMNFKRKAGIVLALSLAASPAALLAQDALPLVEAESEDSSIIIVTAQKR